MKWSYSHTHTHIHVMLTKEVSERCVSVYVVRTRTTHTSGENEAKIRGR